MQFIGSGDVPAINDGWETFDASNICICSPANLTLIGSSVSVVIYIPFQYETTEIQKNYKKRLHYITEQLIPDCLTQFHPQWKILMEIFLKYLDDRVYQKTLSIENVININNKDITDELISQLYNQYGGGLINEEHFDVEIDDKKNFSQLGKFINNLKGTKLSLEYLFKYLSQSQIVGVLNKKVFEYILQDISENKSLLDIDPNPNPKLFIAPFTYNISVTETFDDLPSLLRSVHPAGFNYVVSLDELLSYNEEFSVATINGSVKRVYPYRYDGLYKRMGYYVGDVSYKITNKPILHTEGFDL